MPSSFRSPAEFPGVPHSEYFSQVDAVHPAIAIYVAPEGVRIVGPGVGIAGTIADEVHVDCEADDIIDVVRSSREIRCTSGSRCPSPAAGP